MKRIECLALLLTALFSAQLSVAQGLSDKHKSVVAISATAAKPNIVQLKTELHKGLDNKLTINEIKEIFIQLYAYAGFPRSLNAFSAFKEVLDERKAKGITDSEGQTPTLVKMKNKLKEGTDIQARLLGRKMKTSVADFVPTIDNFLKEHLFADIFSRNVLDFKTRQLVTISILSSIGNAEPQLTGHIQVSRYNGVNKNELSDFVNIIKNKIGISESQIAQKIINKNMVQVVNNPFGLVYQNAITQNEVGKVNIHPITYQTNGIEISANIYTPANYNPDKKYPAIVVAHPNGGVKEQVSGLYAQLLAEQGYITIAADATYQGASGGFPRQTDKPFHRINDIHAMIDFISTYKGVDIQNIGALGICGGGGYTLAAAQSDKRLKAIATVSMFNTGIVRRNGLNNTQIATIQERLQQASHARALESKGEILYTAEADLKSVTDAQIAQMPMGLYRDGTEYYGKTHYHPNANPRYTTSSLLDLMTFDATEYMKLINNPLLMIVGDKADTAYMSEEAFAKATGTTDKEFFKIKGATHIETYWKPEYVTQISRKLTEFYNNKLK